ncbi:MAG: hypothetical protein NXI04_23265 [Planctomycetaceae bacterium]|nr:hypothetical protein [Planctomycetaceae bacterium]
MIPRVPGLTLWAWFRPHQMPSGVRIGIPPEVCQRYPAGLPFTMADLLLSAGIAMPQFQAVSLFGGAWQPAAAFAVYLNQPVPVPAGNARSEIGLLAVEQAPVAGGFVSPPMAGFDTTDAVDPMESAPTTSGQMYDRIETAWKSAIQMERQLAGVRQKLSGMLNSLNKLDRELTPEERLSADREDKDNWEEARRWSRDLAAKCHREIKQFDIGLTSAAGRKNSMQAFYEQVIEPRQPCSELETYRREFETYRKDMVNLQRAMTSAVQAASQNGTQRAQRVLSSIGRKIRERRRRMREPVGGTNMDRSCRRKS